MVQAILQIEETWFQIFRLKMIYFVFYFQQEQVIKFNFFNFYKNYKGGLGVTLTAAETVIFYDNDWNPTMDA